MFRMLADLFVVSRSNDGTSSQGVWSSESFCSDFVAESPPRRRSRTSRSDVLGRTQVMSGTTLFHDALGAMRADHELAERQSPAHPSPLHRRK